MTPDERAVLLARIHEAIARKAAHFAADEVLREIEKTHLLIALPQRAVVTLPEECDCR